MIDRRRLLITLLRIYTASISTDQAPANYWIIKYFHVTKGRNKIMFSRAMSMCDKTRPKPRPSSQPRISKSGPKWVRLAPNGTNPGLFQIRFSTFWLGELNLIWTSPGFLPFGPKSDIPVWSTFPAIWHKHFIYAELLPVSQEKPVFIYSIETQSERRVHDEQIQ